MTKKYFKTFFVIFSILSFGFSPTSLAIASNVSQQLNDNSFSQKISSEEGGFSILVPSGNIREQTRVLDQEWGRTKVFQFDTAVNSNDGIRSYGISYWDLPEEAAREMLDGGVSLKNLILSIAGKSSKRGKVERTIIDYKEIAYQGYFGVEVSSKVKQRRLFKNKEYQSIQRVIMINRRFFQMNMVIADNPKLNSETSLQSAKAYFDTFQLNKLSEYVRSSEKISRLYIESLFNGEFEKAKGIEHALLTEDKEYARSELASHANNRNVDSIILINSSDYESNPISSRKFFEYQVEIGELLFWVRVSMLEQNNQHRVEGIQYKYIERKKLTKKSTNQKQKCRFGGAILNEIQKDKALQKAKRRDETEIFFIFNDCN